MVFLHLIPRLKLCGPPRFYECWKDEGENRTLKAQAASSFGGVIFHRRTLVVSHLAMSRKRKKDEPETIENNCLILKMFSKSKFEIFGVASLFCERLYVQL